ncbi:hypothetical protein G3N55_00710 [Dissulfurirhabdus thermomarina]|uniref:Lipoprotein n=1 Tax=Dissulfurirhabdus thermomarina TaxID=1765737 RepID=A0A6N9TJD5_DISTH|nr:hypothetical protein [Dissulfurirhabdus thermomarina]NDY41372.1 hypothetical protein [Dissulfurirhabdus thermomarina]NMX23612.1 hypothetical protein [Dissulfurirhabdus thermomarina]
MTKMREPAASPRLLPFLAAAILALSGCARLTGGDAAAPGDTGEPGARPLPAAPQVTYEFPDLPFPVELERVPGDSMMSRTPDFQGGLLVLQGRVTPKSLVEFFAKTLPEHGWKQVGSLYHSRSLLAFTKPGDAFCFIQISEPRLSLQTRVEIWVNEPRSQ